jgi:hypothetical protein
MTGRKETAELVGLMVRQAHAIGFDRAASAVAEEVCIFAE